MKVNYENDKQTLNIKNKKKKFSKSLTSFNKKKTIPDQFSTKNTVLLKQEKLSKNNKVYLST